MIYPDIYFTPEYQELFKDTDFGGEPECFNSAGIEYRFYRRPIEGTGYFDIVSPYGYSGPIGEGCGFEWESHRIEFERYCDKNNIITEFARLHPFERNALWLEKGCIIQSGEVIYINLTQPFKFDKGCKSSIKKAIKSGISVGFESYPFVFHHLYTETMKHNKANKDYFFDILFFGQLLKLSGACQFNAWYNGEIIASIIVLVYGDYAHYFLAGSDEKYLNLCPNNLLLSEAIKWAKEQDCKIFNFGGGKDKNHSSFKRSFSHTAMPFFTYHKVHNQQVYDELCMSRGIDLAIEKYFPAYRKVIE